MIGRGNVSSLHSNSTNDTEMKENTAQKHLLNLNVYSCVCYLFFLLKTTLYMWLDTRELNVRLKAEQRQTPKNKMRNENKN